MSQNHAFTIYNASAGSGKTFTLVKEYLKILFRSNNPEQFRHILAITFTNKAVAEMKDRIINMLKAFSNPKILNENHSMFLAICVELQQDKHAIHKQSKSILNTIMYNYAAFDISTIDGFTHKLIRTFAYDLKLPVNFEVELDQDALLNEAVDSLIARAGTNAALTSVLVDFAIEKADDDKSWDVAFDFNKIAKLLVNENDIPFLETLKDKTLEDFNTLKSEIKKDIKALEKTIVEKAQNILTHIEEAGLEFNDFSGSYLPKHFKNLTLKKFDLNFTAKWQEDLEHKTLYPKRVTPNIAETIETIQPQLAHAFNDTKTAIFQYKFLKTFYKNITPLSVLNAINNELSLLKEEQNKLLISEFNTIISDQIKDQPTPFIYERIGEKFKHYFIDEFQDTSVKQWENLIPLLENTLAAASGSAMIVGDAKQAIYRWRGGKAEQFIDLFNKSTRPFPIQQEVSALTANYRSFKDIVTFNNGFFNYLADHAFSNKTYQELYEQATQDVFIEKAGYVELSFLNIDKDDNRDEVFPEGVLQTIQKCKSKGFSYKDICVLVRKKKEGVAIANYLSQQDIPIISSETLLIYNAPEVVFITKLLGLLIQPENNELKIAVLNHLTSFFNIENKHAFFTKHLHMPLQELFKSFETYNVNINSNTLLQLPLYDLVETIVRRFHLVETSNAYIQFFLDIVLEFSQKKGSNISGFLDYFNAKKDSLSIVSPIGQDAVQIMTIHKSKGLEFPVVIFPYADLDIYRELEPKAWFKLDAEKYHGFSHTLLNYSKDFENYGEEGYRIYNQHQGELELDNINLLYVTLTRPVEQLYIISKNDSGLKEDSKNKKYSGLFINYLQHLGLWNDAQLTYSFGTPERDSETKASLMVNRIQDTFISNAKEDLNIKIVTKSGLLWDTNQEEAIEKGNLIHNIMAKVKTKADVNNAIDNFIAAGAITDGQESILKTTILQIVEHPELSSYFSSNYTIYNERDIISKTGIILRPDRVVVNAKHETVIIDYKTGMEDKKHAQQLQSYQDVLEDMNLNVKKKILIYINDDITVKEV